MLGLSVFVLLICLIILAESAAAQQQPSKDWLKPGVEIRGRAEGYTGLNYVPENNDAYYLHRLRLNLGIEPLTWLKFFIQVQDSRAPGYPKPVPNSAANTFDLRQGYVALGDVGKHGWGFRFGRQELSFGDERLVGPSNWSNVGRTFDAARLSYARSAMRLNWFASSVVVNVNGEFDRPRTNNKFYGFYSSFDNLIRGATLQPFFFWKTNSRIRGESGELGDLDVYTYGIRTAGKLPRRFDYNLEMALQTGHSAADDIRAWAGHWVLGYAPWKDERAPRLIAEYNYASGDKNPGDGRQGTFDQLYPTNHSKYGIADRIGWRNMRDAMGGVELKPASKWKLNIDYHAFWLADRHDALYNASGVATVHNPNATSGKVGDEVDFQATFQVIRQLQIAIGCAHLFPGDYLKQSTQGSSVTYPYAMWNYKF